MDRTLHSTSPFRFPNAPMEVSNFFISVKKPHTLFVRAFRPSLSNSPASDSGRLALSQTLQIESLKILEWSLVCKQLAAFTSTSMAFEAAQKANIPLGRTREESQKLLDQTTAAEAAMEMVSQKLDFSGVEDISAIVNSAASGELLTVAELCAVRRTLRASRELFVKLESLAANVDCSDRYLPLLEILHNYDFLVDLERKIEFCLDCKLSIVLDRASEELELIRSERKRNVENLDSLLKSVSSRVFQAGGIDRPLITKRRARKCVGVRASHKHLLPDGVVLNVSSSGATYFMEPRQVVELNNMEVRLSNSEKAEEKAILSLLTTEVAESKMEIEYLMSGILEFDLAFARASHARWINGVCPSFTSERCKGLNITETGSSFSVYIDGIQNPLLLESSLRSLSGDTSSGSANVVQFDNRNMALSLEDEFEFPVPIDIQIKYETRVVVISGPNTGGKTASIKTLGLASLMAKAGMYLPAKNQPKLPWFDLVLADIGDHQSLEQNLSTFSGHISRICKILDATSNESLVLIDEIGCGTDPSEGVALSVSILKYLKSRVNLALLTTHYVDLTIIKEEDSLFENAAMEFSLETLRPTYRILWGRTGDSNALNIAKSIGFDPQVIENAKKWMEKLTPEKQDERKGLLYQSLVAERNRLETQRRRAASLHAENLDLYNEIQNEAKDLDMRVTALKAHESGSVEQEIRTSKSKIETVIREFESQLRSASVDQFNVLIRKSEIKIASIVHAHHLADDFSVSEANTTAYTPQLGEQVLVMGLGNKFATVVEAPADDENVLVQYGKIKVRVKKSNIRALPSKERKSSADSIPHLKRQVQQSRDFASSSDSRKEEEVSYGPMVQTSKNTVDLRGMRVEEASYHLEMAISAGRPNSFLFVIHGMGTGAIKECALDILKNHPRVAKYEQESPLNYGCTVAYIK